MAHENDKEGSEQGPGESLTETSFFDRRSYLRLGAAAAGTLTLGTATSKTPSTDRDEVAFDRTVDAVDDLGMDPSGREPIDDILSESFERRTLIQFPPGRYLLERSHRVKGLSNFGISGLGDQRADVAFVTADDSGYKDIEFVKSRNIVVENVVFEEAVTSGVADSVPDDGNLVFTSVAELQAVARQAEAGTEPWASAREDLLSAAEDSVDASPVAYDRDDGRALAEAARDHIRHTALAYFFTGEERFAEAAVEHIHAFLVDEQTRYDPEYPVIPHARIINSLIIPGVLFGASIVKNHPHWERFGGEWQVQEWCRTYVRTCKEYSRDRWGDERRLYKYSSNRFTYRLSDRMANAVYLRDDGLWNECLEIWDDVHNARIDFPDAGANLIVDADGAPNGRSRREGWEYALFDLDALVACAEIAHQRGTDLYHYVDDPDDADIQFPGHKGDRDGPLLERTFEWFNNVFRNPSEFDGRLDGGVSPPNVGRMARGLTAYEYAGSRYDGALGDDIRDVLTTYFDRPGTNRKYTGFPTLTSGSLQALDVEDGSDSQTGNDTGGDDSDSSEGSEDQPSGGSDGSPDEQTVTISGATAVTDVEVRVPPGASVSVDEHTLTTDVSRTHPDGRGVLVRVAPGDTVELALSGADSLQNLSVRRGTVVVTLGGDTVTQSTVPPLATPSWEVDGAVPALPTSGGDDETSGSEETGDDSDDDRENAGRDGEDSESDEETTHDEWPIPAIDEPSFDRVLDAVDDLGIDDTGERPISDELKWLDDGTLVTFPPGEYTIEAQTGLYGKERIGLRAADGATFYGSADSSTDGVTTTLWFNDCRDVLLDNLTFDQGGFDDDVPNVGVIANVSDGLYVRDMTMNGANDLRNEGDMAGLTVNVTDPDGEALIERLRHTGPADYGEVPTDAYSWAPVAVRPNHEGHVHFVECHIEGSHGGGAVFSGQHPGTTGFDRCYLVNNNIAGPRLSGGVVRDTVVHVDWQRTHPGSRTVTDYATAVNGIYVSAAPENSYGTLIENCDIWMHTQPYPEDFGETKWGDGAAILIDPESGGVTVRDNRIRMDTRQRIVWAMDGSEPRWSHSAGVLPRDQRWVSVENNDIVGMGREPDELVYLVERPGSSVTNNRFGDDAQDPDVSPPFEAVIPPRRDRLGDVREGWNHELTSKLSREQLVANIPDAYRERIEAADFFAPYNAVESRENTDKPTANEGGLNTFTVVDDGRDVEYELDVQASEDTANVRYGMVHHGPRAMSDNRHMMWTIPKDSGVQQPPLEYRSRFSDSMIVNEDAALLDGKAITAENLPAYIEYLTANPREFYSNVHTERFETEAVRGQLRPAAFSQLSREELLETVLATAGPEALEETGPVLEKTVSVVGVREAPSAYTITVDGSVEPNPERGVFDANDRAGDGVATGTVGLGSTDSYRFSGTLEGITLEGEAAVFVDGSQVDPSLVGTGEDPTLSNVMYVDGRGEDATCEYEFSVSDYVVKAPAIGSVETDDTVHDGTVTGRVTGDVDAYRFSGTVEQLRMNGSARVRFGNGD